MEYYADGMVIETPYYKEQVLNSREVYDVLTWTRDTHYHTIQRPLF